MNSNSLNSRFDVFEELLFVLFFRANENQFFWLDRQQKLQLRLAIDAPFEIDEFYAASD